MARTYFLYASSAMPRITFLSSLFALRIIGKTPQKILTNPVIKHSICMLAKGFYLKMRRNGLGRIAVLADRVCCWCAGCHMCVEIDMFLWIGELDKFGWPYILLIVGIMGKYHAFE